MASIQTLTNIDGSTIYPQTITQAVYDKDGKPLDTKLESIDESINTIKNSFTVIIPASDWTTPSVPLDDYTTSCHVTVPGITANDNPKLFTNYISTTYAGKILEEHDLSLIKDIITYDGYIIAYAYQAPLVDLQIKLAL